MVRKKQEKSSQIPFFRRVKMAQPLTPEEEEKLKELRRRKAKMLRDQKRVRKYSPRVSSVQLEAKEETKP